MLVIRILRITAMGVMALAAAQAGAILTGTVQTQIGGANGLTQAYILNTGGQCAGCVQGALSNSPSEVGYQSTVFSGATGLTTPIPSPGSSLTDTTNGVTFNLINESTNASTSNAWNLPVSPSGAGGTSVTIPVGLFGVTDIWAMASLYLGANNGHDFDIILNFGSTQNATNLTTVTVKPLNAAAGTGVVQNSVVPNCPTPTTGGCTGTGQGQNDGAVGPLQSTGQGFVPNSDSGPGSGTGVGQIGALTTSDVTLYSSYNDPLYTSVYTGGVTGPATGTVSLNDVGLVFGGGLLNFSENNWLVSVTIRDSNTSGTSGVYLSALTADSLVSTPEPGTIVLLLTGLSAVGLGYSRRKSA